MKKQFFTWLTAIAVMGTATFTACNDNTAEDETNDPEHMEDHEHDSDEESMDMPMDMDMSAMNDKYVCPMMCEDEKVYDDPGSCPVCGMDRVQVSELTEEGKEELHKRMTGSPDDHDHEEDDHEH